MPTWIIFPIGCKAIRVSVIKGVVLGKKIRIVMPIE